MVLARRLWQPAPQWLPESSATGATFPTSACPAAAIGAGKGERAVASYDEDSVSMAVEAARDAVRGGVAVDAVLFATTSPAYAEKLDTATIQAALDLPESGQLRRARRLLAHGTRRAAPRPRPRGRRAAARSCAPSDVVVGAPGGARESQGGDGAVAFVTGPRRDAIARVLGRASATIEILDVWRLPEERFPRQWEERFTADTMAPAIADAAKRALDDGGRRAVDARDRDPRRRRTPRSHGRACRRRSGSGPSRSPTRSRRRSAATGVAHAGLLLARALDQAKPGDRILVVSRGRRRRRAGARGDGRDQGHAARAARSTAGSRPSATTCLQHLSQVARHPAVRAAAPARPGAARGAADAPARALEARRSSARAARSARRGTCRRSACA